MSPVTDPAPIAAAFRSEIRDQVSRLPQRLKLVGFLSSEAAPSATYAKYTVEGCHDVGIDFDLRVMPRLELEEAVRAANDNDAIHGVIVYYPVFGTQQDGYLKDSVHISKDVEGLNAFWARKLYADDRCAVDGDPSRKAILPCTPLAIVKILETVGAYDRKETRPLAGKTVAVFNRSEVVGRPLASMLAHDGARVYSFDVDGPQLFEPDAVSETDVTRASALAEADIVVSGVPSKEFPLIRPEELKAKATCINFAHLRNFDKGVKDVAKRFFKRIGPVTVAMCLRNTLRLYHNFHDKLRG